VIFTVATNCSNLFGFYLKHTDVCSPFLNRPVEGQMAWWKIGIAFKIDIKIDAITSQIKCDKPL
jgi:hypothetical protein